MLTILTLCARFRWGLIAKEIAPNCCLFWCYGKNSEADDRSIKHNRRMKSTHEICCNLIISPLFEIFLNKGFFHFQNHPLPYSYNFPRKRKQIIFYHSVKFLLFLVSHPRICFREQGFDFIFSGSIFYFCSNLFFVWIVVVIVFFFFKEERQKIKWPNRRAMRNSLSAILAHTGRPVQWTVVKKTPKK
jgi:hypothetical protein